MDTIKSMWNWLVVSSADPSKTSLTVKAAGVLAIPYILQSVKIACGIGLVCIGLNAEGLNSAIDAIAHVIDGVLFVVGGIAFLYGFARKIILSFSSR